MNTFLTKSLSGKTVHSVLYFSNAYANIKENFWYYSENNVKYSGLEFDK